MMPPKKNQQNEDEMEEIRKYLSFLSEEISIVAKTTNTFHTDQTNCYQRPGPEGKVDTLVVHYNIEL